MNLEHRMKPIEKRLECSVELPPIEDDGDRYIEFISELLTPSEGESIALDIMTSRDEPVNGIKEINKPPQEFLDLVQTIIERYRSGEWDRSEEHEAPGIVAGNRPEPRLNGVQPLDKAQITDRAPGTSIESLYYEGSLLWALTVGPDNPQEYHEQYQGETFIIGQAIDAFLESATPEEIAAFNELNDRWKRTG